jgi:hypothetical protein
MAYFIYPRYLRDLREAFAAFSACTLLCLFAVPRLT